MGDIAINVTAVDAEEIYPMMAYLQEVMIQEMAIQYV